MVGFGSTVATLGVLEVDIREKRSSHSSEHGYPNANEISDGFGGRFEVKFERKKLPLS